MGHRGHGQHGRHAGDHFRVRTRHELPFEDFVTTKNKALALATGKYILFMDADERLLSGAEALRAVAEAGEWDAVSGRIIDGPAPDQVVTQYDRLRLWRNDWALAFYRAGRARGHRYTGRRAGAARSWRRRVA